MTVVYENHEKMVKYYLNLALDNKTWIHNKALGMGSGKWEERGSPYRSDFVSHLNSLLTVLATREVLFLKP